MYHTQSMYLREVGVGMDDWAQDYTIWEETNMFNIYASNDGLCLADVWAGLLQFSTPDKKKLYVG